MLPPIFFNNKTITFMKFNFIENLTNWGVFSQNCSKKHFFRTNFGKNYKMLCITKVNLFSMFLDNFLK